MGILDRLQLRIGFAGSVVCEVPILCLGRNNLPRSLVGTAIKTPNATKLGSLFSHRGRRIGPFEHEAILSPVAAERKCLRLFNCMCSRKSFLSRS
jgi:hypothetical protein